MQKTHVKNERQFNNKRQTIDSKLMKLLEFNASIDGSEPSLRGCIEGQMSALNLTTGLNTTIRYNNNPTKKIGVQKKSSDRFHSFHPDPFVPSTIPARPMIIMKVAVPRGIFRAGVVKKSSNSYSQKYTSSTSVFTVDAIARRIRVTMYLKHDMVMVYVTRVRFVHGTNSCDDCRHVRIVTWAHVSPRNPNWQFSRLCLASHDPSQSLKV